MGRRRLHDPARGDGSDRRGNRRPTRSPEALSPRSRDLHGELGSLRSGRRDRRAGGRSSDPGSRGFDDVRDGAGSHLPGHAGREARTKALAAYGAAIGASFALGPFIGGIAHRLVRLAGDLPRQRADRDGRHVDHLPLSGRGSRSDAQANRSAGADHPDRWVVPAGAGAAARQRGRLGQRRDHRRTGRRGSAAHRLRRRGGSLAGADASAAPSAGSGDLRGRRWRCSRSRRRSSRCSST